MLTGPPPLPSTVAECHVVIRALWEEIGRLQDRLQDLESRLAKPSSNSSRPPSSDPPWRDKRGKRKRKPPKERSGRRPGRQPGHEGKARPTVAPERVDAIVEVRPDKCDHCDEPLPATGPVEDYQPHQVGELPKVRAFVTEYRLARVCCLACGETTKAKRPAHVPAGSFGPRLDAAVATMSVSWHMSRRQVQEALLDLFELEISLGAI